LRSDGQHVELAIVTDVGCPEQRCAWIARFERLTDRLDDLLTRQSLVHHAQTFGDRTPPDVPHRNARLAIELGKRHGLARFDTRQLFAIVAGNGGELLTLRRNAEDPRTLVHLSHLAEPPMLSKPRRV